MKKWFLLFPLFLCSSLFSNTVNQDSKFWKTLYHGDVLSGLDCISKMQCVTEEEKINRELLIVYLYFKAGDGDMKESTLYSLDQYIYNIYFAEK